MGWRIPSNKELNNNSSFEYITTKSGEGANENIEKEEKTENKVNKKTTSLVNINTATQTELETLPGIGPSIALKIINYRKENGKFSNVEELKHVNGIGDNKFEAMKKYVTCN